MPVEIFCCVVEADDFLSDAFVHSCEHWGTPLKLHRFAIVVAFGREEAFALPVVAVFDDSGYLEGELVDHVANLGREIKESEGLLALAEWWCDSR